MIHLSKLAVGVRDPVHLAQLQAQRLSESAPGLRHHTRMMPQRRDALLDGGSIYWVIAGLMLVRQRLLDLQEVRRDDGSKGTALLLDPALVAVHPRAVRAFQGWRYLQAPDAPPDLMPTDPVADLPAPLRIALQALALL